MLGGFLLLGVNDDRTLHGWNPPEGTDVQSHLGELLRDQVDPLPPYIAEMRELDGHKIGVVRVFESVDSPHVVRGTGAIVVRSSKGNEPVAVDDHQTVLALARRGEEAGQRAPPQPRAALTHVKRCWTPTPALSRRRCSRGRAVARRTRRWRSRTPLASSRRRCSGARPRTIQPPSSSARTWKGELIGLALAVAGMLREAEAYGRALVEMVVVRGQATTSGQHRALGRLLHVARELTVPADEDEVRELAQAWYREMRRAAGIEQFEDAPGSHE